MTNDVLIRVAINDDTQTSREKIKAAFAAMGAEAAAAFRGTASKGMKDAGADVGAEGSDAFREMAMMGFGVAGEDAAKAFSAKSRAGVKGGGADAGAEGADAFRELAVLGFGIAGEDAGREFNERVKGSLGDPIEPKVKPSTDEPASEETGKRTTEAVGRGMTMRQQLIATAIGGALLGGGPLVDAAAIGTGVLFLTAMGATIQRGNAGLQAGWAKLKDDATTAAQAASQGIVVPLGQAMDQLDGMISREAPLIKKLFDDAGADVPILVQGVDNFVTNSLPGLESGLVNSQQVMSATAGVAGDLGQAVGEIGASFGQNSSPAVTGLKALGSVVIEVGHDVSELIGFTTRLGSGALPTLASGFNGLLGGAGAVLHVLEPIAPLLGSITAYGVEAWGSFKLADLATTGVNNLSKSLNSAAAGLTGMGTKLLDSKAGSSIAGQAMAAAAGGAATFAGKAASLAENLAGPLGLALGLVSGGLMLFGQNSEEASRKAQEQAQFTQDLSNALKQSGGAFDANVQSTIANQLATDSNAATLEKYGVAVGDMEQKLLQGNGAIDKTVSSLQAQKDAITDNAANYAQLGETGSSVLLESSQKQVDALDDQMGAWKRLADDMAGPIKQQKDAADAINGTANMLGIHTSKLTDAQRAQEVYDSTLLGVAQLYMQDTAAIKQYVDATVAAAGANLNAQQQFQQLDDAVVSAQQAVVSAANGVASAQHSLVDAGHAVDSARHSEQQAVLAVTEAQYGYQQSLHQEQQAQQAVMAARQAAADQLASLQRQVADQGDSLAAAKLRLEQAQSAVDKAGLHGRSLADMGDPTASNETQYQLLLELSQAQHALNDTQAQGTTLAKQAADAQKAGIDGSDAVIAAEEQLAQAKHSTQQAALGVQNAQYAEKQASQAVSDAIWAQHSAQVALTQAQYAATDAQKKLTAAKDADSRTLDINTAAGNRNWQTIEDLYEKNRAAGKSVEDATRATEDQTVAMGFDRGAVQGVIDTMNGLNNHTFRFSVVGTPTLDLGPVRGILNDPTLGLFTNQSGASGGIASAGRLATGGPVTGPGGPRDDQVLLWGSNGEFMQPADSVDYYGLGFMEAIRSKRLPRFASGGRVAGSPLGLNAAAAAAWGLYETAGAAGNALGASPRLPLQMPPPGNFSRGQFGFFGGTPGVPSSAAANEAIVRQVWANYGWDQGTEWDATVRLLMQESGFNNRAQNPTSTARGIFQFLDSTWAGYGIPKTDDPTLQTIAGGRYIKSRYGDPLGAWAHERAFNWYGAGGPTTDGLSGLHDQGPEIVRLPNGSTVIPHSGADKGMRDALAGYGGAHMTLTINAGGSALDRLLLEVLRKSIRQQGGNVQLVLGTG